MSSMDRSQKQQEVSRAVAAPRPLLRIVRREIAACFVVAAFVTLFINLGMLFVPVYDMILYDRVLTSRNMDTVTMLSVGCVVGMTIYGLLEFLRSCLFVAMGDRLARRLNIPTLKAAISASLGGADSSAAQAMRDLNELRLFVSGSASSIPLDLLWTPALFGVLFLLHPAYGVYALACASLLFVLSLFNDLTTRRSLAEGNAASTQSLNDLAASLRHVELLDGMGMLPALARRWQRVETATRETLDAATRRLKAFATVAKICRLLMQAGVIALGVVLVLRQEASPGSMMGANLLIAKLLLPFDQLVSGWRQWTFAWAAWRRVTDLLGRARRRREGAAGGHPSGRLVVENLYFAPEGRSKPVLKNLSFALEPGEAICIVGPSGAGKSTLARLIVGVFEPTVGSIRLDGRSTFAWERDDFGRNVGYLPQSISLLDGTIFDNIARMTSAASDDVVYAAAEAGIHDMIGRLPQGYSTPIGSAGFALSGGQRQRIALARALFGAPKLLVLDEPNSNLDHEGEQALIHAIGEAKRAGATVVVVTHRPAILNVVDKILVLEDGELKRFGPRPALEGEKGTAPAIADRETRPRLVPVEHCAAPVALAR
jgi:ATP-binding cassette subfamily C protein